MGRRYHGCFEHVGVTGRQFWWLSSIVSMLGVMLPLSAEIWSAVIDEQVLMKGRMTEGIKGGMAHRKIKILEMICEI